MRRFEAALERGGAVERRYRDSDERSRGHDDDQLCNDGNARSRPEIVNVGATSDGHSMAKAGSSQRTPRPASGT